MDRNSKVLMILGGYGNTGQPLSRLLLQETDARIILAGRRIEKARTAARLLNELCGEERVSAAAVDASDPDSLARAFPGVDMVVVASSTARYAGQVASAALETGADYYDIQYSNQKTETLKALSARIEQAGRCFITDGGFHPGLPAALVRLAAQRFDRLEIANVGSVIKEDWGKFNVPLDTMIELVEELNDYTPMVFRQGEWKKGSLLDLLSYRTMDFGGAFGRQYCAAMFLEEMRALTESIPSLQETGFYVGGFNPFVDWLILPFGMVAMRIAKGAATRLIARWMKWGLETFSKPPFGTILKLEARGVVNGIPEGLEITIAHPDGYLLTAIPVAACIQQYLEGRFRTPGLWTQANLVDPGRFMDDMQRMGVDIRICKPV